MHVSIVDRVLTEAGYDSLAAGLADLKLATIELGVGEAFELPPLDADHSSAAPIGTDAVARTYRAGLYGLGVEVSALGLTWAVPSASRPEQKDRTLAVLRAMEIIGVRLLRVGLVPDEDAALSAEQIAHQAASDLEVLVEHNAGQGAMVALEAPDLHQGEPELYGHVLRVIDRDGVGLAIDPGRLYCDGLALGGIHDLVRERAPYVRHVRCRNSRRPADLRHESIALEGVDDLYACQLHEGDIDYARVASVLGAVGYSGALTVDCDFRPGMEPARRQAALRTDVVYLKDILGQE